MTQPAAPDEVQALLAEQQKEYGSYVAVQPIDIGGARAFNVGDAVPASHVSRGVVAAEAVAKTSTKAAQAAVENGT